MATKKNAYETAIYKMDNSSQNLELAGKIKKQTQIKYSEGMTSSVEVTQTEKGLSAINLQSLTMCFAFAGIKAGALIPCRL